MAVSARKALRRPQPATPPSADEEGRRRGLRERLRGVPRPLALLLLVAFLQAFAWTLVTPPFQGPDEGAHFAYSQYLAETGRTPSPTEGPRSVSTEADQALVVLGLRPLIGIGASRPAWSDADLERFERIEETLPDAQRADGSGPNAVAKNPPLYYLYAAAAYRLTPSDDLFDRMFAMRLATLLLYLATVLCVWLLAAELTRRTWLRTLATGVAALQPMLGHLGGGVVNPDTALTTVWTAFLLVAVRLVRRGPSVWRWIGVFALAAASVLVHGRGLAIVPVLFVVLGLTLWVHRPRLRAAVRGLAAGGAVAAVMLAAWRLVFTTGTGGGLYGGEAQVQATFSVKQLLTTTWQFYFPPLSFMEPRIGVDYGFRQVLIETFYGKFASLEVVYPGWVYDLLQVASVAGVVLLVVCAVERRGHVLSRWPEAVVLAGAVVCLFALLHTANYRALLWTPNDPLIVGRYYLPLIAPMALAVAFVAATLPRRAGRLLAGGVLVGGTLLVLAGLGIAAVRFHV